MAVRVFGPFDLDIIAHICRIVSVINSRRKAVIAKIVSYGYLSCGALSLLPYELVPVFIDLPIITSIAWISITYDRAL
jgi:hypothetical protein